MRSLHLPAARPRSVAPYWVQTARMERRGLQAWNINCPHNAYMRIDAMDSESGWKKFGITVTWRRFKRYMT